MVAIHSWWLSLILSKELSWFIWYLSCFCALFLALKLCEERVEEHRFYRKWSCGPSGGPSLWKSIRKSLCFLRHRHWQSETYGTYRMAHPYFWLIRGKQTQHWQWTEEYSRVVYLNTACFMMSESLMFWDIIFLFLNLSEISVWFYLLFLGWVVSSFNCLWFQVKCYRMSCGLNEFERYAVNLEVSTIYQVSFITLKWSLRFFEYLLDKKWNGVIKDYDIISLYMLCKL